MSGPVLTPSFLVVLDHRELVTNYLSIEIGALILVSCADATVPQQLTQRQQFGGVAEVVEWRGSGVAELGQFRMRRSQRQSRVIAHFTQILQRLKEEGK